ncbi:MAG: transglutaminase domain-containing protein [Acidobacteria bacterium]|nr:transglutaminase domain-containing protein [Acidobacteriota bacterium]
MKPEGRYKVIRCLAWLLVAVLLSSPLLAQTAVERWWELRLSDQPVGYFQESTRVLDKGRTLTAEHTLIVLNRLGKQVSIRTLTETTENADGVVEVLIGVTSSSAQTVKYEARVHGQSIMLRMETGGKQYERTLDLQAPLLGPKGVEKLSAAKLKNPGDEISYQMFSGDFGKAVRFRRLVTEEDKTASGKLVKVEEEIEGVPGKQTAWLDAAGRSVRRIQPLPFGDLHAVPSDAGVVARTSGGGELSKEAYERTMAISNIRLPDPRSIERIKLRIKHRRPEFGWPTFESAYQRVIERTSDTVVLELWRPEVPDGMSPAVAPSDSTFLKPNAFLQSDDAEVVRIARENAAGSTSGYTAARSLHDWTNAHMKPDLGIAMAPASEAVRNRRGTCAAYSMLLASLLRAAGIPSRIGAGYVYFAGIWGGHWWTEVKLGNQWVPLDAAVYRPGPADPARIQFTSTTLADNGAEVIMGGLQMYGNVEVQVLEFTIGGRAVRVPDDAKPYVVEGDVYRNPWLGFSFRKPSGFSYSKLNALYPDTTIVRMEASNGQSVTVQYAGVGADPPKQLAESLAEVNRNAKPQRLGLGGRNSQFVAGPGKARLVLQDGLSLWVLTAEGQDAKGLLQQAAATWEWVSLKP